MQKPIHKFTGALTFRSRSRTELGKGTATLISPNLVLTSAHNIYNKEKGEVYYDLRFYPGQCGVLDKY
jgi:V8-like Glu-specific endopeptidase